MEPGRPRQGRHSRHLRYVRPVVVRPPAAGGKAGKDVWPEKPMSLDSDQGAVVVRPHGLRTVPKRDRRLQ
jgi:hypothetical protein